MSHKSSYLLIIPNITSSCGVVSWLVFARLLSKRLSKKPPKKNTSRGIYQKIKVEIF